MSNLKPERVSVADFLVRAIEHSKVYYDNYLTIKSHYVDSSTLTVSVNGLEFEVTVKNK